MKVNVNIEHIILVAEDDPDDTLMLKDAFSEINQSGVTFLSNGKLLIDRVLELQTAQMLPQLIVVDLNMPILDGRSVIKALKKNKHTVGIPLVVLSTTKSQEDIDSIMKLGAAAFYTKPSSFSDLVSIATAITNKWVSPNQSK